MKRLFYLFSITVFIFLPTWGSFSDSTLIDQNQNCLCNTKIKDPFESPVSFNFGKFKGECVDSCLFRSSQMIPVEKLPLKTRESNRIWISNFLHQSKFYVASVAQQAVEKVEIGFEEFRPGIHHIFLKFTFSEKDPLEIFDPLDNFKKTESLRHLVISAEGIPSKGRDYSLLEGYMENYLMLSRFLSLEQVNLVNLEKKHPIKYYSLSLDSVKASAVLKKGLEVSQDLGLKSVYKLLTNNCSTGALALLDHAIGYDSVSYFRNIKESLPIEGPFGLKHALSKRKLLNSDQPNQVVSLQNIIKK